MSIARLRFFSSLLCVGWCLLSEAEFSPLDFTLYRLRIYESYVSFLLFFPISHLSQFSKETLPTDLLALCIFQACARFGGGLLLAVGLRSGGSRGVGVYAVATTCVMGAFLLIASLEAVPWLGYSSIQSPKTFVFVHFYSASKKLTKHQTHPHIAGPSPGKFICLFGVFLNAERNAVP